MASPGWNEENDEEGSAWLDDYEDGFEEEEEFEDDDDEELEEGLAVLKEEEDEDEEEDDLEAMIEEGEALVENAEYAEAMALFREACERFPESPLALYHLGQTALVLFTDAIDSNPDWEGDDELSGFYEEAMNAFDAALQQDAAFYPALNGQGALFMVIGNDQSAVECWERSLDITPDQEEIVQALKDARAS